MLGINSLCPSLFHSYYCIALRHTTRDSDSKQYYGDVSLPEGMLLVFRFTKGNLCQGIFTIVSIHTRFSVGSDFSLVEIGKEFLLSILCHATYIPHFPITKIRVFYSWKPN